MSYVLINHFKGYLAAPNKEFNLYIKQKENDYEEGQKISEDDIMTMAENKYKSLVIGGKWNALFKEQKEMWTQDKAEKCRRELKEENSAKDKEDRLQLNNSLANIEDDEDSGHWLLGLWFTRI